MTNPDPNDAPPAAPERMPDFGDADDTTPQPPATEDDEEEEEDEPRGVQ